MENTKSGKGTATSGNGDSWMANTESMTSRTTRAGDQPTSLAGSAADYRSEAADSLRARLRMERRARHQAAISTSLRD